MQTPEQHSSTAGDEDRLKRAVEALRFENTRLHDIFEFLPDAAFAIDEHRCVTHWNKAAELMTGVKKQALIGTRDYSLPFYGIRRPILVDLMDSDDTEIRRTYDYVRRNGDTINAETFIPRFNDGKGAYIWIAASALYAADGRRVGAIEVVRDVSDRRLAENRLRLSEERFNQLAENVKDVFWLFDLRTQKILYVSPAYRRVWGRPLEKAYTFPNPQAFDVLEEDWDTARDAFQAVSRGEAPSKAAEFRIRRPDDYIRWIRTEFFPIADENGAIHRIAAVSADVTPFKEAAERERIHQQQLIQADKMACLGVLVAGVAHEVNNPTNYITLSTPLLRKAWETIMPLVEEHFSSLEAPGMGCGSFADFAGTMDYLLGSIEEGAERIKRIVADLKEYARMDAPSGGMEVDLNEVIESAATLMSSHIGKRTTAFSLELSESPALCTGRFQRLEQVVINLIQNACDALTDPSQCIRVSTIASAKEATVIVRDEGCGIPEEFIKKVTDPFFTTKRDSGGTGLGLSVTAGIVKEHNGTIDIRSTPGAGSTVTITVPRSHQS